MPDAGSEAPFTIDVLRTVAGLAPYRGFIDCHAVTRDAVYEAFLFNLKADPGTRPHVIVVSEGATPRAMLIGKRVRQRLDLGLAPLSRRMPRLDTLAFVHGGWLGNGGATEAATAVRSLLQSLRGGEAMLAAFDRLPVDGALYAALRRRPGGLSTDAVPHIETRTVCELRPGKAFLDTLSKRERSHQRQRARTIAAEFGGDLRIASFTAPEEVDMLMRDAEAVAKRSYLRGMGRGFFHDEATRAGLAFEARQGWMRGYVVYGAGKPIAFWLLSQVKRMLYSNALAYDPAFAKHSPGMYLMMQVMEGIAAALPASGAATIDFGRGVFGYKDRLGNRQWDEASMAIFAPTIPGALLNLLRTPIAAGNRAVKAAVARNSLLARWRRQRGYRAAGLET